MGIKFLDPENGNDANDGLTYATAWQTMQTGASAANIAAGDVIRVKASPNPTVVGNMTVSFQGVTGTLAAPCTIDVDMCEVAWTVAAANVTGVLNTSVFKQGVSSMQFQTTASRPASLIGYQTLGAPTDFSSMQQLTFWVRSGTTLAANTIQLALCTDQFGVSPQSTFTVPFIIPGTAWVPVAVDFGSALGNSIQSVAFYNLTTLASGTAVLFDSIFAAKAPAANDSLTLLSQIGRNTGNEPWMSIASISGTSVVLDQGSQSLPSAYRGYGSTGGTFSFSKRECFRPTNGTNFAAKAGTDGSPITYSGGWSAASSMTVQDGETWYDMSLKTGTSGFTSAFAFNAIEKITVVRCSANAITFSANNASIQNCRAISTNGAVGFNFSTAQGASVIDNLMACNGTLSGINFAATGFKNVVQNLYSYSNAGNGYIANSSTVFIKGINVSQNNSASALQMNPSGSRIYNLTATGNATSTIPANGDDVHFINCNSSDATLVSNLTNFGGQYLYFQDYQNIVDNHLIVTDGGQVTSETSIRHTASGIAWKFSPTSTNRSSAYPIRVVLGRIACRANKLVTIKAWIYLDNAAINAGLLVRGGFYSGITNDVQVLANTGTVGSYQQVALTFSPTAQNVIEVFGFASGGTTNNAYFDDLTFLQAS